MIESTTPQLGQADLRTGTRAPNWKLTGLPSASVSPRLRVRPSCRSVETVGAWMKPLLGVLLKLENGLRPECVMERCPVIAATPIPLKAMTDIVAAITNGIINGFF